jgi:hypothetical protein
MTTVTLKTVGPYTVTSDGDRFYVNGRFAAPTGKPPAQFALILDTGCVGPNGKRDMIGLTAEHVAAHRAVSAARHDAIKTQVKAEMESPEHKARVEYEAFMRANGFEV